MDALRIAARLALEGALSAASGVVDADDRRIDHTQYRLVMVDEGDSDGELSGATDEFAGAVERVDQPVALPAGTLAERDAGGLFGEYRDAGREVGQACIDHLMGGHVRFGERGHVLLVLDTEAGFVDFKDASSCLDSDIDGRTQ